MNNSFSGPTTFFRRLTCTDLCARDAVVIGLPMDMAVSNRPGARFGPRALRAASAQLAWGECWPWGIDPFKTLDIADFGDIEYEYGNVTDFRVKAAEFYADCAEAGVIPIGLGGDHHVTAAALAGLSVSPRKRPMGLLQFDAHTDTTNGPDTQHGTMFGHAVTRGVLDGGAVVRVGTRTAHLADKALTLAAPDFLSNPIQEMAEAIHDHLHGKPVYLTFDIDCLDPSCAPGTGTPVPGGPNTLQVLQLIRDLGKLCETAPLDIIGLDLVEVAPAYDHAEITALAGCQILHELMCLLAVCRRASKV